MDITFSTSNWIALLGILISIAIALGIIKRVKTTKERMKAKIVKKLNQFANKGIILVSEIKVRDAIYFSYLWNSPLFKERFFTIFTECIRELFNSEVIIRVNGGDLFSKYKLYPKEKRVSPFPPYKSAISKSPNNYKSLANNKPEMYIGLNTKLCEEEIEKWKKDGQYRLEEISKHY